jgi:hypothetical protein
MTAGMRVSWGLEFKATREACLATRALGNLYLLVTLDLAEKEWVLHGDAFVAASLDLCYPSEAVLEDWRGGRTRP